MLLIGTVTKENKISILMKHPTVTVEMKRWHRYKPRRFFYVKIFNPILGIAVGLWYNAYRLFLYDRGKIVCQE